MENNLAKYIAFIKTAETGSFTRAAENLNYAQSTVSKIIADLEKEGGSHTVRAKPKRRAAHLVRGKGFTACKGGFKRSA